MRASCEAFDLLAPAPRDPEALLAWVDRHCLAGLVAALAHGLPAGDAFTLALQARARRASLRSLRHAAATVRLLQSLAAAQIDAIPLKGAVLSDQLYGDPALRDVRDADLLIRPHHLLEVDAILLAAGFERESPVRIPPPESSVYRHLLRDGYHFEYKHPADKVNVEVHWRLPDWPVAGVEAVWEASETRLWRGMNIRLLADDRLLLLFLCDHGARHRWFRLKWLVDVAVLLSRIDNAARLLHVARRLDLDRPLGQAAALCRRLFGSALPDDLHALAETPECQWLAEEALQSIHAPVADYFALGRSLRRRIRQKHYERQLRRQPAPRRFCMRAADFDAVTLPERWFWLYYPLRPILWLQRYFTA